MLTAKRPAWLVYVAYNFMIYMTSASFWPFVGSYYTNVGITRMQIGLIATFVTITSLIFQPLWAYVSDRLHNRRLVLLFLLGISAVAIFLYTIQPVFGVFALAAITYYAFCSSIIPLGDAIALNNLARMRVNFSYVRIGGTIGFAVCVFLLGRLYIGHLTWMFPATSILLVIAGIPVFFFPREKDGKEARAASASIPEREANSDPAKDVPPYRHFGIMLALLMMFVAQIGLTYYSNFLSVYATDLHYGSQTIGLLQVVSAMSEVPMLLFISKLKVRFGTFRLLLFASFMIGVRLLLAGSTGTIAMVFVAQTTQSLSGILMYYCCITYISANVSERHKSRGQVLYTVLLGGVASALGNLIGGALSQAYGIRYGYIGMGAVVCTFTIAFAFVIWRLMKKGKITAHE